MSDGAGVELQGLPLEALNRAWADGLQAADAAERARWLEAADVQLGGDEASRARARAVYWALRHDLDPSRPDDVARCLALLEGPRLRDAELAAFARRITDASEDSTLSDYAFVIRAQCLANADDYEGAEAQCMALWPRVRGTGTRLERSVLVTLVVIFKQMGREFEALVAARALLRQAEIGGDPWECCVAHQNVCEVLRNLEDWAHLESGLLAYEQMLASIPMSESWRYRRYVLGARCEAAIGREEPSAARGQLTAMRALRPEGAELYRAPFWESRLDAEIALLADAPEQALEALRPRAGLDTDPRGELVRLQAFVMLGRDEEAVRTGNRLISHLVEGRQPNFGLGSAHNVKHLSRAGTVLSTRPALDVVARRAIDAASKSVVRRMANVQHQVKQLDAIAQVRPEDTILLQRYQRRFAREHGRLLGRMLHYLRSDIEAGHPVLERFCTDEEFIRICAWCHRVREPDGAWLPIGHFLPRARSLAMTHGVCPPCRETALDEGLPELEGPS